MIQNIQALRAAAALLVVFVHLGQLLETVGARAFGNGGVDLFFVISGFVMVHTTRGRDVAPAAFMTSRVIRIVPLYWVITLAIFAIAVVAPALVQATRPDVVELLKSLFFVPFLKSNGLVQPTLFVGWTLNYEMFFYALFALGLSARRYGVGLALTAGAVLACVGLGWLIRPEGVVASFYTDPIMLEFLFGMGLALLTDRLPSEAGLGKKVLVGAMVLCAFAAMVVIPFLAEEASRVLTSGLPAVVVVAGAVALERWGWRTSSSFWLGLGGASYALYLTHPFVTQISQKFGMAYADGGAASGVLVALTIAAVIFVAFATHLCLERPMLRVLQGVRASRRLAPA